MNNNSVDDATMIKLLGITPGGRRVDFSLMDVKYDEPDPSDNVQVSVVTDSKNNVTLNHSTTTTPTIKDNESVNQTSTVRILGVLFMVFVLLLLSC